MSDHSRKQPVVFTAVRSKFDNCVCEFCFDTTNVIKAKYPVTRFHDRRTITTKYHEMWICLDCYEKMTAAFNEALKGDSDNG